MFGGHQEKEEYEDELYQEDKGSVASDSDSELEARLYSQVHYSACLGEGEEEEDEGLEQDEGGQGATDGGSRSPSSPRQNAVSPRSSSGDSVLSSDLDLDLGSHSDLVSDSDLDPDGVESWMLLDGEEQEGDANIQLNIEFEASSSSAEDEDDSDNWTISKRDMEAQISSRGPGWRHANRYYTPNESITCRNCGKAGHLPKNCPTPKKRLSCQLCGSSGHRRRTCPHVYCPNCGLPGHGYEDCPDPSNLHEQCHRCGMPGHRHDACPDIWRQYHLTTQTGSLVKPDHMEARRSPAYCYNCSRRGHFGFVCSQRRMSSETFPTVPYVSHYDTPQDVLLRDGRIQQKAKELREAGLLQLSDGPQGGARENEPPSKRKKNKDGEGKGGIPSARKGERQLQRMKTWPEKRKERRQIKKLRREAMAQRGEGPGAARLEGEESPRPGGPEKRLSGAATPPVKGKAGASPFSSGKRSDRKGRKCRERLKGRKHRALKRTDVYPSDENFLPIKRRVRHRKR